MFVEKIGNLYKTRFGVNFKADDIKCNINKKEEKILKKETKNNIK